MCCARGTLGSFARVGQKTQLGRRWAKLGTRPVAVLDQRTASTYIFGAICPLLGKAAGLILPECNIEAMNLHRAEIAAAVAPGAQAALILDQAGWHISDKLVVPPNIPLAASAAVFAGAEPARKRVDTGLLNVTFL